MTSKVTIHISWDRVRRKLGPGVISTRASSFISSQLFNLRNVKAAQVPSQTTTTMTPLQPPFKVGIIGYGLSAKIFHIPFITSPSTKHLFTLHAIVQRTPDPANDPQKDHPGVTVYRTSDELFADPVVQLVIVTTSPNSHFALASSAIEAGKNVIVEKPFTPSSAEGRELARLAETKGVLLTVYQNRRFDADFMLLSRLIREGMLGRVVEFETHFDRHRPDVPGVSTWKTEAAPGTGATYDLGVHLMDQVVSLFGMPGKVTGYTTPQRLGGPVGFEDSCTVLLQYGEGMLVTVKAGVVSAEVEQLRFWVRGTKGSFRKCHLDCQEDQLKAGLRPGVEGYGAEGEEKFGVLTTVTETGEMVRTVAPTPTGDYSVYYEMVGEALRTGDRSKLPVDPMVAADVIRLVELARESAKLGKTMDV
jgi:predicted dehydrogenase